MSLEGRWQKESCENWLLTSVAPVNAALCPRGMTRLPLSGFSRNVTSGVFTKPGRWNSGLVKAWRKSHPVHIKTYVHVRKHIAVCDETSARYSTFSECSTVTAICQSRKNTSTVIIYDICIIISDYNYVKWRHTNAISCHVNIQLCSLRVATSHFYAFADSLLNPI